MRRRDLHDAGLAQTQIGARVRVEALHEAVEAK